MVGCEICGEDVPVKKFIRKDGMLCFSCIDAYNKNVETEKRKDG